VLDEQGEPLSNSRIWSNRAPGFSPDLRGYEVEALDGRIGTVDEATDDVHGGYVVVDTGPWIFGEKAMLPAGVIDRVDHEARTIHVNRTKHQIEHAPQLGETGWEDVAYRIALGRYYGSGGTGFRDPPAGESPRGRT
jgi:hypothetical protein